MAKDDKKAPGAKDVSPNALRKLIQGNRASRNLVGRDISGFDNTIAQTTAQTLAKLDASMDFVDKQNARLVDGNDILTLFTRSAKKSNKEDTQAIQNIQSLFGTDNVGIDSISKIYMMNRERLKIINDIKMITYFMPSLDTAVNTYVDNIISPDDHTKDIGNITATTGNITAINDKVKTIKKRYKLNKKIKRIVTEVIKFGECFVYRDSYANIFASMIANKNKAIVAGTRTNSGRLSPITESFITSTLGIYDIKPKSSTRLLETMVNLADSIVEFNQGADSIGISEVSQLLEASGLSTEEIHGTEDFKKMASAVLKDSETGRKSNTTGFQDGMVISDDDKPKINGSVIKFLKPEGTLPVIINDYCVGYFYLETRESIELVSRYREAGGLLNSNPSADSVSRAGDQVERLIGDLIFKKIDKKFIEDNSNFKEAIYSFCQTHGVLAGKQALKITFLEASKVHHFKIDEDDNGRGVSKLTRSIFPASMHTSITLSDAVQKMTRSYDKRAYFVKQGIDKNISRSLSNAVTQIKKSQFNINNLSNLESLTQLIGRFNDYFIPVSSNGEKPIEFEVISGQDTNSDMDFLDKLERKAVSVTGVPYALIEFRNEVDFAKSLSMANGAFVRSIISAQVDIQPELSDFITGIINDEYSDLASESFEINLPIPTSLNMSNTSEQLNTSMDIINTIVDVKLGDDADAKLKKIVKEQLIVQWNPNIDWSAVDKIIKDANIEVKTPPASKGGDEASTDL